MVWKYTLKIFFDLFWIEWFMDAITESILEEIVKNVRLVHYWQTKKNIRHRNLKKIPKWGITDIFMYQLIPASAQFPFHQ